MNLGMINSLWRPRSTSDEPRSATALPEASEPQQQAASASPEERRFIARQTIFDASRKVFGYELLCRSGWENYFSGDPDRATRMMIADGSLYGFKELTHGAPSFVNCTRDALVNHLITLLPTSTVLEVLETVVDDPEVLAACAHYKSMGYKLALDDFRPREGMQGLIGMADYIKVDFRLSDAAERRAILDAVKASGATLIAEKIETEQEFQDALAEGFSLFQGYFFCYPTVLCKHKAPAGGANYLSLLAALSQEQVHISHLAALLKTEVSLCYQVLRLVNSAEFGMSRSIESLEDALIVVGERQFSKLLLNAIATETCRGRTSELLVHVLHRARFLELMAPFTGESAAEQYLFGILSLMDVMLETPSADLVKELPLRDNLKQALCGAKNSFTAALRLFERYGKADWQHCIEACLDLRATESEVSRIYQESLLWAEACESRGRTRVPANA
jgi:EAL and modified HD-GYP domain-containing signal transduction protein